MLKWLKTATVAIIPSEEVIVELKNDSGTFEADPLHYQLSTLNFSFLWTGEELILSSYSVEQKVSYVVGRLVQGNLKYFENHGSNAGIVYEVIPSASSCLVRIRNLENFDFISYRISTKAGYLTSVLNKGTSTENFWSKEQSSKPPHGNYMIATFTPVPGDFSYLVPLDYGLHSLKLELEFMLDKKYLNINFNDNFLWRVQNMILISNHWVFSKEEAFQTPSPTGTIVRFRRDGILNIIETRRKGSSKYLQYLLSIHWVDRKEIQMVITWRTLVKDENQIPVFSLPPGSLPRIEGSASLTPDGNMVCELDYEIINNNYIKNYIIYNLDFLSEVKGCKGTIPEAVSYLQQFQKVDQTSFVGYAITRLILSQVLFGKFDTHYLLQRYYPCFLSRLRSSVWKEFLPFFLDPQYGVENYHLLFK
jgi:hypothetical protein